MDEFHGSADNTSNAGSNKNGVETLETAMAREDGPSSSATEGNEEEEQGRRHRHQRSHSHTHFKVYKRRWIGLAQLVLMNIVVSWDWLTFAPVSTTSATYFRVSESSINWLSTAFLFSFIVASPLVIWTLNRGPKDAIVYSSVLLLVGNWVRYGGTRANAYGATLFGQILIGFSQPFVLAAPTRYSDLWFTETGRVSATAVASLANPFGGALGQLINPFWTTKPSDVPNMVLYIAIIATIAALPAFFIPAKPPTPPSASSALSKIDLKASATKIYRSPSFWLIFIPFSVYVGFFNAFSSLLNQILYPYGYTESEAGICGALLIVVGLVAAAITSPILDRTHAYLLGIRILVPIIAACYLALIWAPQTRTLAAPYVLSALLGSASFSLVPIALEYLVEVTFPASPEVGSTICWAGGQLLGAISIIVMNALKEGNVDAKVDSDGGAGRHTSSGNRPAGNMFRSLVFEAILAIVVVPVPLLLGVKRLGLGEGNITGRLQVDEHRDDSREGDDGAANGETAA